MRVGGADEETCAAVEPTGTRNSRYAIRRPSGDQREARSVDEFDMRRCTDPSARRSVYISSVPSRKDMKTKAPAGVDRDRELLRGVEGIAFMVMPKVEGRSLRAYLEQTTAGPIPPEGATLVDPPFSEREVSAHRGHSGG